MKTELKDETGKRVHPYVPELCEQLRKGDVDRREFLRGFLSADGADGSLAVHKYPRDGSGLISGLRAADGLIELPEDVTAVAAGDTVAFIPFGEFGIG